MELTESESPQVQEIMAIIDEIEHSVIRLRRFAKNLSAAEARSRIKAEKEVNISNGLSIQD